MTTRQWMLYNFLKDNYSDNKYISKKEICDALPEYFQIKDGETRVCRDIEFDVRDINADQTIQKIIVSNKEGYKLGNPSQVHDYVYNKGSCHFFPSLMKKTHTEPASSNTPATIIIEY